MAIEICTMLLDLRLIAWARASCGSPPQQFMYRCMCLWHGISTIAAKNNPDLKGKLLIEQT